MKKKKLYNSIQFSVDALRKVAVAFQEEAKSLDASPKTKVNSTYSVTKDEGTWEYDTFDEFCSEYRVNPQGALMELSIITSDDMLYLYCAFFGSGDTDVSIRGSKPFILRLFDIFEQDIIEGKAVHTSQKNTSSPKIFIGHGRSNAWKNLKDHLTDKHKVEVIAFETGARAGHSIRDILEELTQESSFAILVFTAEDEHTDGSFHARENVIHEAGLFQGKLGFPRAIMLLEEGVKEFSNIHGIQHISFSKANIKETFGDVLATLNREFPHGYKSK